MKDKSVYDIDGIFSRWDHNVIYEHIQGKSKVLDLGCGNGELLQKLGENKDVNGLGIEKDINKIQKAISRGVAVIHADIDEGLSDFPDKFYDYVILEKTLQAVTKPMLVLDEMLRVGRYGIISFPNFGHKSIIEQLASNGRMPVTDELPHNWYDTPNIHLFTINDFMDWINNNVINIRRAVGWDDDEVKELKGVENETNVIREALFIIASS